MTNTTATVQSVNFCWEYDAPENINRIAEVLFASGGEDDDERGSGRINADIINDCCTQIDALEQVARVAKSAAERILVAAKLNAQVYTQQAEEAIAQVDQLKGLLLHFLQEQDKSSFATDSFVIKPKLAGGKRKVKLLVEKPELLPVQFQRLKIEPNLTEIAKALELGDEQAQSIAELEPRKVSLEINLV